MLLFTDGYSTEPLQEAAAQMQARGIPLDFRLIREETENDFRLARIGFPERVQVGEPFLISITVRGASDATFPLILRRNGQTLTESSVTLVNGTGHRGVHRPDPRAAAASNTRRRSGRKTTRIPATTRPPAGSKSPAARASCSPPAIRTIRWPRRWQRWISPWKP